MPTAKYLIADTVVEIETKFNYTHRMCSQYLYTGDKTPELKIAPTQEEIEAEREIYVRTQTEEGHPDAYAGDNLIEFTVVHGRLAEYVLDKDILLMHGSVVAVNGEAYLFTAKSGTGKSTHTALWMQRFPGRAQMVNGDKPFLKVRDDGVIACGSPWNGKERLGTNIQVPLKAICVLERDKTNHIALMDSEKATPILIQQTFRPDDVAGTVKSLSLVAKMSRTVPVYQLGCNMDPEAAEVAYRGMSGEREESAA